MPSCAVLHPTKPGVVCLDDPDNHPEHWSMLDDGARVFWENESFVAPPVRTPRSKEPGRREIEGIKKRIPKDKKPDRRRIGRPSSVAPDDPFERMKGSEEAGKAVEPEFVEAFFEAVIAVGSKMVRFTSDDLWDWLDAHEHFTAHPKAVSALLRTAIKRGLIESAPDTLPDAHRPSRRSNQSRLNRVYVFVRIPAPAS